MKPLVKFGLFWLEYLAYWKGHVTVKGLAKKLGVTRETVQREIISESGHLQLARKTKVGIKPTGDVYGIKNCPYQLSENLKIISADKVFAEYIDGYQSLDINFEDLSWLTINEKSDEIFRKLQIGIVCKSCFHVDYVARSGIQAFDFSPHAIVKSNFRCHFRGFARYSDKTGKFIDLVPGRIIDLADIGNKEYTSSDKDDEWNNVVFLIAEISDDRKLTEINALNQEYGDIPLRIRTRRANIRYIMEALDLRYRTIVSTEQSGWQYREER